jgi:hypothetical protein
MSTIISAPLPLPKVTVVLPSAELGDSRTPQAGVDLMQSMDGTETYTYIRSNNRLTLLLSFNLTRMKSLELREFVRVYFRAPWHVTLHDGSTYRCQLAGKPVEQVGEGRAAGWPGGESVNVRLELSATPLAPPAELT